MSLFNMENYNVFLMSNADGVIIAKFSLADSLELVFSISFSILYLNINDLIFY